MANSQFFKVFVYGTLKRGEPNYHWLTSLENGVAKFIGEGTTVKKFPLVVGAGSRVSDREAIKSYVFACRHTLQHPLLVESTRYW